MPTPVPPVPIEPPLLSRRDFEAARERIAPHIRRTPLFTSRILSERTGFDVRLKAEMLQRTGAYKIRGALNKIASLSDEERRRGVICSSAGNHAQGVALAARIHGVRAVVVMAVNATPSKIEATQAYGAEVVLHGRIWDEANQRCNQIAAERGLTIIHPFDDRDLVAGQGTLGLELYEDWPEVELVVVPVGGGGLISGVAQALKACNPKIRVLGIESSGGPKMKQSVEAGKRVVLERVETTIDGLRVRQVGAYTFDVARRVVDGFLSLPDRAIFDAVPWIMHHCKLVAEGAAAAPVAALLAGAVKAPRGTKVACVLSGGNLNLDAFKGRDWN